MTGTRRKARAGAPARPPARRSPRQPATKTAAPAARSPRRGLAHVEASERRLRALIENSADAITLLGADGTILYDTPAAPGMLGFTSDELIGRNFTERVHPADLPLVQELLEQVARQPGSQVTHTFRFQHKNGQWLWLEAVARNLLHQPDVAAIVVNYGDLTVRKTAELERERYEVELDLLYRSLGTLFRASTDLEALADVIVNTVTREFGLSDCGLMVLDEAGEALVRLARSGDYDVVTSAPLPMNGEGLTVSAVRTGETVYAPDVSADPHYVPNVPTTRSELAVPLHFGGRVRGVLDLQSPRLDGFDESTRRVVAAYAERASLALDNARLVEETRQRAVEAETLGQAGAAVAAARTQGEAIGLIFEQLARVVPYDSASVQLLHEGYLEIVGGRGWDDIGQVVGLRFPIPGDNPNTEVIRERRPVVVASNFSRYPVFGHDISLHIQSWLGVPLVARGETIGMLTLDKNEPNFFTPNHVRLAATFADQVAAALDKTRLLEETARRAAQLATLYEISRDLMAPQELLHVLQTVVDRASKLLAATSSAIMLYDAARGDLVLAVVKGSQLPVGTRLQPGEGMAGRVMQTRLPLMVDDYSHWEGRSPPFAALDFAAAVQVPLLSAGEFVGVLDVSEMEKTGRRFTAADADLLTLLAGQAANAIQRARLHEETVRRASELEAIAQASAALRAASARSEMLPIILDQVMNLLTAAGAAVDTFDPSAAVALMELGRGVWATDTGLQAPLHAGVAGRLLANRRPYVTTDVHGDGLDYFDDPNSPVTAVAAMPLLAHDDIIGALWVGRESPFTPDDVRLLAALADLTANALYRAALHEQTVRRAEQLTAMNALARSLAETLDLNQIYERLAEAVFRLLPDTAGLFISLYDPAQSLVTCGYAVLDGVPLDITVLPPIPLEPPGVGTQSEAIHTRQPVIVNDLNQRLARVQSRVLVGTQAPTTQSGLYVPMLAKSQVIGVIQVQAYALQRYTNADADLLAVAANTGAVAIENARLFTQTEQRLRRMQALHSIDAAISSSLDLRVTLNVILEQTTAQLRVDAADVLLLNRYSHALEFAAGRGFRARNIERARLRIGEGQAGKAALERRVVTLTNVERVEEVFARPEVLSGEGIRAYSAVPLVSKGLVVGVLEVFHRAPFTPDAEWLNFLDTLAGQAAIAVDNAELFEHVQRSNVELSVAYDATIEGWSRALDLRDKGTEGHTRRVTDMTLRLAMALGQPADQQLHLQRGALLHDIGKMGIPDSILLKPGPLTDEEWAVMRRHPDYAYEMLAPIHYLHAALDIPYCHHEKWDGTGYPRGLNGDVIPLAARIFTVVDVWDALCSDRPYRKAWPPDDVLAYIRAHSGTHFDPRVVEAFLEVLKLPEAV